MSVRVRSSSVGAHPRPKPVLVSRAESTVPVAAEVRCGCQFYQSTSLLPDRINPVGQSRPQSSVDYYVEPISRPISPLSIPDPSDTDSHFERPASRVGSHSRVEIIRPEPIIISAPIHIDSPTSFRPIQERPLRLSTLQNNSYMEPNQFDSRGYNASPIRESTPVRPSLIGKDRLSDRHINVSTQILRNRSRSTSLHGGGDNVGKIVKTVSFEFGGPDGPDQYRSPYAAVDLNKRNITGSVTNNNVDGGLAIGNKNSAHSFVKFERKDHNTPDRYFSNDRYN